MFSPRQRQETVSRNVELRKRSQWCRDARLRLRYEILESRQLLAADLRSIDPPQRVESLPSQVASFTWFDSIQNSQRLPLQSLEDVDPFLPLGVAGPLPRAVGEWIVQLNPRSANQVQRLNDIEALLDDGGSEFHVISGLGSAGLILVRGESNSRDDMEASLERNAAVDSYHLNQLIEGQTTTSNDPEFIAGLLPGLGKVDAANAWDVSRGSSATIVGIVDTGVDPTHPDLYLNIWLNQGELPLKYLDDIGPKLTDIDNDGLITFYDLNNATRLTSSPYTLVVGGFASGPNTSFVRDLNGNGRIEASDLLADANWADGRDTDSNGFFDDFFGVNFRAGVGDPFAANNPADELGHGTHVAGTIGAIGGNATGVVGLNWQTSLMSLRILDNNNQGDSGAAIRAINYAREMRERLTKNSLGRVTQGANVKVLNNSWGQPGGFEASLETAIEDIGETGILFVAAAGNGNFLGQGVDNDRTPFFPASYEAANVIAVAASDSSDRIASFSNFGASSVDLLAPGVGVRSTLPGGSYGAANGTSMATPHVSGAAALVWSAFPEASFDEVVKSILSSVTVVPNGPDLVLTGGRLNAAAAINANVFAPSARLISAPPVTDAGNALHEVIVQFNHRSGINVSTIDDGDIIATRQWGPTSVLRPVVKPNSIQPAPGGVEVTFQFTGPAGSWDPLDYGDYVISTVADKVSAIGGQKIQARTIGKFNVRINDSTVLYVDSFSDSTASTSFRSAIIAANEAAPQPRTIILNAGTYSVETPPVVDPTSSFVLPTGRGTGATLPTTTLGWSNATTGDFDILGNITIVGDQRDETTLDGKQLDRLIKVHQNASLSLRRLTLTGGAAPTNQPGGGILSAGTLSLNQVVVRGNRTSGTAAQSADGGGIAVVAGSASIIRTQIADNTANASAGILFAGAATGTIDQSTIDSNQALDLANSATYGAAIGSYSTGNVTVTNSTIASNRGIAVYAGVNVGPDTVDDRPVDILSLSTNGSGRFTVFSSSVSNLVPGDTNNESDVFLHDRVNGSLVRISVNLAGAQGDGASFAPDISSDGTTIVFASNAKNLVQGDTNGATDVFAYNRLTKSISRVSVSATGVQSRRNSTAPTVSGDGRYVAFESAAIDLVDNSDNDYLFGGNLVATQDIFRKDRTTGTLAVATVDTFGDLVQAPSLSDTKIGHTPSISHDGQRVVFTSDLRDLGSNGTGGFNSNVYVRDFGTTDTFVVPDGNDNKDAEISGDGTTIVYMSSPNPGQLDSIYAYRIADANISLVSSASTGQSFTQNSVSPSVNFDATRVTFASFSPNVIPLAPALLETYEKNLVTGSVRKLTSIVPDGDSSFPAISSDGSRIAFYSLANNLTAGSNSRTRDVFMFETISGAITSLTSLPTGKVTLLNDTLAFNSGIVVATGNVHTGNSLYAGNTATEAVSKLGSSLGNNLFDTASGPFVPGADILDSTARNSLGALTSFPIFTPGYPLIVGSAAINAANPAINPVTVDQRNAPRQTPDIGAFEAIDGLLSGAVFGDLNGNQIFDREEPGFDGITVFIDLNKDGVSSPGEPAVVTSADDPATAENESGAYTFSGILPGEYFVGVVAPPGFTRFPPLRQTISLEGAAPASITSRPSISASGQRTVFESTTSILVPGGTLNQSDVYLFDTTTGIRTLISSGDRGDLQTRDSHSPTISDDGRYIAYFSGSLGRVVYVDRANVVVGNESANARLVAVGSEPDISGDGQFIVLTSNEINLVANDGNNASDVFRFNRANNSIVRISNASNGSAANGASSQASVSRDGRFIAFTSTANNLVSVDGNNFEDVFVYDVNANSFERVKLPTIGFEPNGNSHSPSISDDGRYVAFVSAATNLVANDRNSSEDVFIYDRTAKTIRRISVSSLGAEGNASSSAPAISGDGGHVVFASTATNLVVRDTNNSQDAFIYDLLKATITRATTDGIGAELATGGYAPSLSRDGEFVGYRLTASNVVVARNPLEPQLTRLIMSPGDQQRISLGLVPKVGQINGTLFEDSIANLSRDLGEPIFAGWTVFLDTNRDGKLGDREVFTQTDSLGRYAFSGLPAARDYSIAVAAPTGWTQVLPDARSRFRWTVTLPAGGIITDRDFGFVRVTSTGQSSNSSVSGRLFDDRNGNKKFDVGIDFPIADREVYLDAKNFGVRDLDEPRVLTNGNGLYSFPGLSSRVVAISTTLDETLIHVSPLGSDFSLKKHPLFSTIRPFGNPQAISSDDFNKDGFLDVAVALGEANRLSIRLNDGQGGFLPQEIDVDLGAGGTGPTSIVVGQFDTDARLDVALTANYSSNVVVLLNYNATTKKFLSQTNLPVGQEPIDIVAGQFGGNSTLDLVVLNKGNSYTANDESVQVLTNRGNGSFIVGPPIPTGGKDSVSLVAGNFTGDASLDVAVTHASPQSTATPLGGVTVLQGNGAGQLTLTSPYYQVGASPIDSVSGDFNNDGRADLAVANFSSNSISILRGQANGTFRVQAFVLGTASGAFDIAIGDVDNDGDIDVVASNLKDRNISVFRNIGVDSATGDVRFEPLENVGLGQFSQAQRMPLVLTNFDNDRSAPGGAGTLDIVTIPQQTDTLHVLKNKLVNGSRRVALTGTNTVTGMDFIIKPAVLPPSFNTIPNPSPIVEDASQQTLTISGITKGRASGPALRFSATSSNLALIANPAVSFIDGRTQATVRFTPIANTNGTATITVRATDAGADQLFGGSDDGIFERSFVLTVLPVNDAPSFTVLPLVSATQKAGAQTIASFAKGITNGGGADEATQSRLPFVVTADASFFTVTPTISSNGTLKFTPNPNKSGVVPVTVTLADNGGKTNGGIDRTTLSFVINILPVNDAPSFNLGSNITVQSTAGAQSIPGFASGFNPGGGSDESTQRISDYLVAPNLRNIFAVLPDISNTGVLTFTPAAGRSGTATVNVRVRDNGGQLNGGVDLSALKTFTITVKTSPVVNWSNPADIVEGTRLSSTQLNASSATSGTFLYSPRINTLLNIGANQLLTVTFTPTDMTHFNVVTKMVKINVVSPPSTLAASLASSQISKTTVSNKI